MSLRHIRSARPNCLRVPVSDVVILLVFSVTNPSGVE